VGLSRAGVDGPPRAHIPSALGNLRALGWRIVCKTSAPDLALVWFRRHFSFAAGRLSRPEQLGHPTLDALGQDIDVATAVEVPGDAEVKAAGVREDCDRDPDVADQRDEGERFGIVRLLCPWMRWAV
jgi:hypothetical protein